MMTLPSYTQILLLRRLIDAGGHVSWADLSQGECRNGTLMERQGLCQWAPCPPAEGNKRLEITDKGRAFVDSEDAMVRVARRREQ